MLKRLYTHTELQKKVAIPQTAIRGTQRASQQHNSVLLFIHFTDVDILVEVTGRQAGRSREINWLTCRLSDADKHTNKADY